MKLYKIVWWLDELNHRLALHWRWLCDWNDRLIIGDEPHE